MTIDTDLARAVQALAGVDTDGIIGNQTLSAIYLKLAGKPFHVDVEQTSPASTAPVEVPSGSLVGLIRNDWPKEANAEEFFGYPPELVSFPTPYPMHMDDTPISSIRCNAKVADSLHRIFLAIKAHYGTQDAIAAVGLDKYDGCYNDRPIRGQSGGHSMHAYGAAIDLDAEDNELGHTSGKMPAAVVAMFKAEGWRWGGDYTGRKDWMHFEACS